MRYVLLIFFLFIVSNSFAQQKYWVYLSDKDTTTYNPYTFFDQKAIDRRIRNNIPIYDISDVPVNPLYLAELALACDSVSYASRWFNAVCLYASEEQIAMIKEKNFVVKIEPSQAIPHFCNIESEDKYTSMPFILEDQTKIMQGQMFHEKGITGKGVRIAIFDGGFPNVDILPCFSHIRDNKRIIKTWDFTRKKEDVYRASSHGTVVLSCIAGISEDSIAIGLAIDAEFLLARTEVGLEPFSEEENWLAALEWADKYGADIVNSSLGYTFHRYFPYDMDGKTAFVSRAANTAASKGILVVNAAGNEGSKKWKIIGAPADADSILSVGGVNTYNATHINFSSYGPTADGRLKPNVCAYGQVYAQGKKTMGRHYGTSFASPLVAGFAACALQTDIEMTAMELFQKIQESASLYPYYDYAHGYGIPQASYFLDVNTDTLNPQIDIINIDEKIEVSLSPFLENQSNVQFVYIHVSDAKGHLLWYEVITANENPVFSIAVSEINKGSILRVHYAGLTKELIIK